MPNAQCFAECIGYHSKYLSVVAYRMVIHKLIIIPLNFYKNWLCIWPFHTSKYIFWVEIHFMIHFQNIMGGGLKK